VVNADIWQRLNADSTLVALVSAFGGSPSIFNRPQVPPEAPRPYIWIQSPLADVEADEKNTRGRDVRVLIACVGDKTGSVAEVAGIAARVRTLLHRYKLPIDGGRPAHISDVTGPTTFPSDESVYALALTLRVVYQES